MKRILYLMLVVSFAINGMCQDGSAGSPFTALGQAQNVGSNGIYFFDIGGNAFSTQVEVGGWVLVASGSGTGAASLTTTSSLTVASDGILPVVIYTSVLINELRFNATTGPSTPFDVTTTNATVLSNLQNNRTLSLGIEQLGFAMWSGTGTSHMDIWGTPSDNSTLNLILYHANGNFDGLHWRLPANEQVDFTDVSKNPLNLWVKAAFVSLPVELVRFNATAEKDKIRIDWTTATEINNDYFTIEKSIDGNNWQIVEKVNGAGNSSIQKNYIVFDRNPVIGRQFYRLKQTNTDQTFRYSSVRSVLYNSNKINLQVYPNPVAEQLNIKIAGQPVSNTVVKIFDMMGKNLFEENYSSNEIAIDTRKLSKGHYIVEINSNGNRERIKIRKD